MFNYKINLIFLICSFFISSTKEGYLFQLHSEKIIGLAEEEILEANPKNTLTDDGPTKFKDFPVAVFNKDGMFAPIISLDFVVIDKDHEEQHSKDLYCNGLASSVIINDGIILTGSMSFYDKPPMFPEGYCLCLMKMIRYH